MEGHKKEINAKVPSTVQTNECGVRQEVSRFLHEYNFCDSCYRDSSCRGIYHIIKDVKTRILNNEFLWTYIANIYKWEHSFLLGS